MDGEGLLEEGGLEKWVLKDGEAGKERQLKEEGKERQSLEVGTYIAY